MHFTPPEEGIQEFEGNLVRDHLLVEVPEAMKWNNRWYWYDKEDAENEGAMKSWHEHTMQACGEPPTFYRKRVYTVTVTEKVEYGT